MFEDGALVVDNAGGGSEEALGGGDGGNDEEINLGGDGGEGGGEGDQDPDAGGEGGDEELSTPRGGRTDAKAIRAALREALTGNEDLAKKFPRLEKDVTAALFSRGEIDKLGGIRAVSDLIEKIETRGGIDQIEADYEELDALKQLEEGMQRGDPAIVAGWAKDFPDGLKRTVLPMFEALTKLDEVKGEQVGAAIWTQISQNFGVLDAITEIGRAIQAIKADDPARADLIKHFNPLVNFAKSAHRLGGQAKQDPYAARAEELDRREQSITEKDRQAFQSAVKSEVNTRVMRDMNERLLEHLRTLKVYRVEKRTADRIRVNVGNEIKRLLAADPTYSREYNRIVARGDRQAAIDFVVRKSSTAMAKAIKSVLPDFNLKATGKPGGQRRFAARPANAGGNASGGGSKFVSGAPKTSEVDFTRTDKAYWLGHKSNGFKIAGQAFLKDGRVAKWGA